MTQMPMEVKKPKRIGRTYLSSFRPCCADSRSLYQLLKVIYDRLELPQVPDGDLKVKAKVAKLA